MIQWVYVFDEPRSRRVQSALSAIVATMYICRLEEHVKPAVGRVIKPRVNRPGSALVAARLVTPASDDIFPGNSFSRAARKKAPAIATCPSAAPRHARAGGTRWTGVEIECVCFSLGRRCERALGPKDIRKPEPAFLRCGVATCARPISPGPRGAGLVHAYARGPGPKTGPNSRARSYSRGLDSRTVLCVWLGALLNVRCNRSSLSSALNRESAAISNNA